LNHSILYGKPFNWLDASRTAARLQRLIADLEHGQMARVRRRGARHR
jgi:hypothetical protein